jgi:hypothetical protein
MAADSRSVTTDALATLGMLIGEGEKRDAIHLAVEPVVCGARILHAGEHVKLVDGKAQKCPPGKGVGIVDPFMETEVIKGERFWLVVYPRQITSLRHVWDHPAFPASELDEVPRQTHPRPPKRRSLQEPVKAAPRAVAAIVPRFEDEEGAEPEPTEEQVRVAHIAIERIASSIGEDYDDLMDAAETWVLTTKGGGGGSYWSKPNFQSVRIPDEFWNHYEVVKRQKVADSSRGSFLSCSCS